jgi:hypothetical protein
VTPRWVLADHQFGEGSMRRNYLQLRFDDDGDGTGKLLARAESGGFAGEGGAHFSATELESFALALAGFPLPDRQRLSIAGGFWKKDNSGELDQELLSLTAYPIGKRGYIGVQIRIATEIREHDRPESKKTVSLEIVTSYEPLGSFSRKLIGLVRGSSEEAILEGEELI